MRVVQRDKISYVVHALDRTFRHLYELGLMVAAAKIVEALKSSS